MTTANRTAVPESEGEAPPPPAIPPLPDKGCLNCALTLEPHHLYCPRCGQDVETSRVSVGELLREAWGEFVQIDSKLTRTLVALAFHPGKLTREYLTGKRVRYLSPFKMYLVVAALFFALASWIASTRVSSVVDVARSVDSASTRKKTGAALGRSWHINVGPSNHAANVISIPITSEPDSDDDDDDKAKRAEAAAASAQVQRLAHRIQSAHDLLQSDDLPDSDEEYDTEQRALPPGQRDSGVKTFVIERAIRIRTRWENDRGGLVGDVIGYFPDMMFFLLPVCALLLRLLYARREWLYVEHLVFALHLHTVFFLFCALSLALTIPAAAALPYAADAGRILWCLFLVYGFLAARRVYGQGILKTLLKGALLVQWYLGVVLVAIVATIVLALARI